jgi:hypothetical protein
MTDDIRTDRHVTDEPDGSTAYEASLRAPGDSVTPTGDDTSPAFDAGDDDTAGVDPHAGYDAAAVSGDTPEYRPED